MTAAPGLTEAAYAEIDALLAEPDASLAARYPGEALGRQPVHTVYVPADRYRPDLPARWGAAALDLLERHASSPAELASLLPRPAGPMGQLPGELPGEMAEQVYQRVLAKLAAQPIEDLRLDVEDGYGTRPDEIEDADVRAAGAALAQALADSTAPPFVGLRLKGLEPGTRRRGLRSLDLFLGALLAVGPLPPGLVLTLPKVSLVEQVEAMVIGCEHLERGHGLAAGRLRFEVQVETPQAVLAADGRATVARMIHVGQGRVSGLHFGTYDYSAAVGVAARYQSMAHPAADHAKAVMQVAAAGTGVRLSDGSTNVLPVGDGDAVRAAWALHASLVRRSLERGFYQGWDLHPGHLVTRFAATYAFYLEGVGEAADRLRGYLRRQAGGVLDEPATVVALSGFLLRGIDCGATDAATVAEATGLRPADLEALARPPRPTPSR